MLSITILTDTLQCDQVSSFCLPGGCLVVGSSSSEKMPAILGTSPRPQSTRTPSTWLLPSNSECSRDPFLLATELPDCESTNPFIHSLEEAHKQESRESHRVTVCSHHGQLQEPQPGADLQVSLRLRSRAALAIGALAADDDLPDSGFGNTVGSFGSQFTPFASRTFQSTKEMLGQTEDKVSGVNSSTVLDSHADDHPPW